MCQKKTFRKLQNHQFQPVLVGGWPTPLKNDGLRQLGSLFIPNFSWKVIHKIMNKIHVWNILKPPFPSSFSQRHLFPITGFGVGLPPYSPESRSGSAISRKAAPVGSPRRYLVKPPRPPRPPVTLVKITRIFTRGEFYGLWSVYDIYISWYICS